jgi:hypothetical protein
LDQAEGSQVIKLDKLLITKRPFAFDLSSFVVKGGRSAYLGPPPQVKHEMWEHTIHGVWFRRKKGRIAACRGTIYAHRWQGAIKDPLEFLASYRDGGSGGYTAARWDGESYWGIGPDATLARQQENLLILRPMLENYPEVPQGYDGWYQFT